MIRQAAFEWKGPMLKGGLHCHTTRSDGRMPPDEVMRLHKANGYDFLAITDHRRYNFQSFAPETELLVIPGMEMDRELDNRYGMCYHTVAIGPAAEDGNGFTQDQRFQTGKVSGPEEFQPVLDRLLAAKNLCIYCHPDWSCTPYTSFDRLEGFTAMEVWNSGCVIENGMDSNAYCWDELLREGRHIWGVATDDGHAREHHCRGWVRVAAEKRIDAVLDAIRRGAFYASCGPELTDFYVEDGRAVVRCAPVSRIRLITGTRPTAMLEGEGITELAVPLGDSARYVRAEITDARGQRAWSNPIFLD